MTRTRERMRRLERRFAAQDDADMLAVIDVRTMTDAEADAAAAELLARLRRRGGRRDGAPALLILDM